MSQTYTQFTTSYPTVADLTETERHRLLKAERRRLALDVLADRSSSVDREELAAEIARQEDGCDPADDETVESIEVSLHHKHLPKMDRLGVIEYRVDSSCVV